MNKRKQPDYESAVEGQTPVVLETYVSESKTQAKVNVVFSFDTTGSMSSIIHSVQSNLTNTIDKLYKEVEGIQIGVICHGDYCDYRQSQSSVLWKINPTDDFEAVKKFVKNAKYTSGGDAPECYELALQEAASMKWNAPVKVLVMIGDQVPHEPGYKFPVMLPGFDSQLTIDWRREVEKLKNQKVNIFSCHALASKNRQESAFYKTMASATGGMYIEFEELSSFPEYMVGICLRAMDGFDDWQMLIHRQEELKRLKKDVKMSKEEAEKVDEEIHSTQAALLTVKNESVFSPGVRSVTKNLVRSNATVSARTRSEQYSESLKQRGVSKNLSQFLDQLQ
jgi:hypothetical protein